MPIVQTMLEMGCPGCVSLQGVHKGCLGGGGCLGSFYRRLILYSVYRLQILCTHLLIEAHLIKSISRYHPHPAPPRKEVLTNQRYFDEGGCMEDCVATNYLKLATTPPHLENANAVAPLA